MSAKDYIMSDREYETFSRKAADINKILHGTECYLIIPILMKVLVCSHMVLKDITEKTPGSLQLHDNLIAHLTDELVNETDRFLIERN